LGDESLILQETVSMTYGADRLPPQLMAGVGREADIADHNGERRRQGVNGY
jgi:hypothetical protein